MIRIEKALQQAHKSTDGDWKAESLFLCLNEHDGDVQFLRKCDSCKNGGTGNNDHC